MCRFGVAAAGGGAHGRDDDRQRRVGFTPGAVDEDLFAVTVELQVDAPAAQVGARVLDGPILEIPARSGFARELSFHFGGGLAFDDHPEGRPLLRFRQVDFDGRKRGDRRHPVASHRRAGSRAGREHCAQCRPDARDRTPAPLSPATPPRLQLPAIFIAPPLMMLRVPSDRCTLGRRAR